MGKEPSPALTIFRCSCSSRTPVTLKKNHLQQYFSLSTCDVADIVSVSLKVGSFHAYHPFQE